MNNLVDKEFLEIAEDIKKGKTLKKNQGTAARLYKHPIKKRTIKISEGQRRGVRHG
jgi:hypothetical protein